MSKKILIVRHAESLGNIGEKSLTPETIALSPLGKTQAKNLVDSICWKPDLIITSKYIRTLETAESLIQKFPDTPVEVWGIHEFTFLNPEKYKNTSVADRRPFRDAYWERCEPYSCDGGEAETFFIFFNRVKDMILKLKQHEAKSIIIFSHELFILCLKFMYEQKELIDQHKICFSHIMPKFRSYMEENSILNAVPWDISDIVATY